MFERIAAQAEIAVSISDAVMFVVDAGVGITDADEVVCVYSTEDFYAVGQFFDDFSEVTDDMVVTALARPRMVAVPEPRPTQ